MKLCAVLASIGLMVAGANAHGGVLSYSLAGQTYNGWRPYGPATGQSSIQRKWTTYDPIVDMNSSMMRCNNNGETSSLTATVAAGSQITAYYNGWPHPHGPVFVWMAKCPGKCSDFDGSGKRWFKIDQAGLISGDIKNGLWGTGKLMADGNRWTSTIPAKLAPGEYLLRHELIALHAPGAPQFYPECAQLTITGSGTSNPASSYLASIPGVYSVSDASLNINIYAPGATTTTTWNIPGPAVFK